MTETKKTSPLLTLQLEKQLKTLSADTQRLYLMLGALTDAVSKLPELHLTSVIKELERKAEASINEREALQSLADALKEEAGE